MSKSTKLLLVTAVALVATTAPTIASATETVTYTYDARDRIVKVVHAGTVNNGINTTYSHDKADNRTQIQTTGASH